MFAQLSMHDLLGFGGKIRKLMNPCGKYRILSQDSKIPIPCCPTLDEPGPKKSSSRNMI
jgi:hypothetical protein